MLSPVTRVMSPLSPSKLGERFDGSAQASPSPVAFGVQSSAWIPLPQKKMPNVVGSGSPAANAVPLSLHMTSSTGNHRETPTPESIPLRACRRETLSLFRISILRAPCREGQCGGGTEGVAGHEIA